jgi:hypothetical protein
VGAILGGVGLGVPSFTSVSAATPKAAGGSHRSYPGYIVYWDQNEEQDFFNSMTGQIGQLVAPYDPNGQMCIFPEGSGRFVTGYNRPPPTRQPRKLETGDATPGRGGRMGSPRQLHGSDYLRTRSLTFRARPWAATRQRMILGSWSLSLR